METKEKVIATRHDLKSIELFMGYVDGYLSENITWNDLMPVVEKIESMAINEIGEPYFVIMPQQCDVISNSEPILSTRKTSTKIHMVYSAILEFINWYNTTRPTESNN